MRASIDTCHFLCKRCGGPIGASGRKPPLKRRSETRNKSSRGDDDFPSALSF
ncbi:hypothetical protein BDZ97DRAFT_1783247 [Flammula alnicola]|nr:hypothetical protein BDZ97DRAFT_1783247 [Flammula alnicola]